MHAWRNNSKDKWLRMLYVLVDAQPLEVGSQKLEEKVDGIVLPGS